MVRLNGQSFGIVGVMPPAFRGLELVAPDFWAPIDELGRLTPDRQDTPSELAFDYVIGRLRPGIGLDAATTELTNWIERLPPPPGSGAPPRVARLIPRGTIAGDAFAAVQAFVPLFAAFGLILLIGCANVANLLLARGMVRQREIGIRLSLGASRRRIVRQLLTEGLLLALAAAICGFFVSRALMHTAVQLLMGTGQAEVAELVRFAGSPADWRIVTFLTGSAVLSTVFFALAPALRATRLELVRTMRGEVIRDARPGLARHVLLTVQVGASALLLICAAVFLRSALAAAALDPGVRTADTVFVDGISQQHHAAVRQAVRTDPLTASIAATSPQGFRGETADASAVGMTEADGSIRQDAVNYKFVSPEYFDLLGIDVLAGRGFRPDERSPAAGVAVVSDRTARELWPDSEAVGQVVQLDPWEKTVPPRGNFVAAPTLPFRTYTVIGVVPHFRFGIGGFRQFGAGVYVPIDTGTAGASLVIRVKGDPEQARRQLSERLSGIDPALGRIWAVRTAASRGTVLLDLAFWTTAALGALALALTASGLFGVLSYLVEQRRKEIGVRMALGALPGRVLRLVLAQSLKPVAIGGLAGAAFAGVLAKALVSLPVVGLVADAVRLFDPLAYAASLLCIVIACLLAASIPAIRAARTDPIAPLREE
jgi:predicted permease